MIKLIKNCLATTGITLLLLATVATMYQGTVIFISSIYESFVVNIIIHVGLLFVRKLESNYSIIELFLSVGYVLCVLIVAGFVFNWYSSTPLWVVVLMGVCIFAVACIIDLFKINEDIKFINHTLKKRKEDGQKS